MSGFDAAIYTCTGMKGVGRTSTLDLAKLTELKQLELLDLSYFDNIVCKG